MAGGTPVFVPLRPPSFADHTTSAQEWTLNEDELRAAITPKTRGIILNTPHNPTGKVFTQSELEMISRIVIEHNMIVFSDEVYEFLMFGTQSHIRMANLPDMWDRTITICVKGAGKTFSVTGWKIGWLIGPQSLINSVALFNQYKVFSVATPLQRAVAKCIQVAMSTNYFDVIKNRLHDRYEQLLELLDKHGLCGIKVHAGYFTLVDIGAVKFPFDPNSTVPRDYQFCRWLPQAVGLAAIPTSAFYSDKNKHLAGNYVRFAFCKKETSLQAAQEAFAKLSTFVEK
jgi:aspartate/methionine/tyrosine aminotransferase